MLDTLVFTEMDVWSDFWTWLFCSHCVQIRAEDFVHESVTMFCTYDLEFAEECLRCPVGDWDWSMAQQSLFMQEIAQICNQKGRGNGGSALQQIGVKNNSPSLQPHFLRFVRDSMAIKSFKHRRSCTIPRSLVRVSASTGPDWMKSPQSVGVGH